MMDQEDQPGGGQKKHPESTVYISNLSEDVWPFIQSISDPVARRSEIEENAALSDRDLFTLAGEDNVLFITPHRVSDTFLAYFRELTGKKNFQIVTTREHTGEICRDVIHDRTIIDQIITAANSSRKLTMLSYTTSFEFLRLVQELRSKGITVNTPESPEEEDAWTVNFYGSKSGIRQLAQQSVATEPDFLMPDGIICVSIVDAARIAAKWYIKNQGVVIKTNKGHSGAGLLIFRPGDLPGDYKSCEQAIHAQLKKDAYWDKFPIIVEDYMSAAQTIGGGFPNVEFKILRNGHVELLYYCGLRVTDTGVFKGVEIHTDALSDKTSAQIVDTGFFIAERYAQAGYRGYFDVDYIAAKNGKLYITESNVRRTGGTHVYHLTEQLFGKDFMHETYTLSNNNYPLPAHSRFTFAHIMDRLEPVLYDRKKREGVVIVSENLLARNLLAYVIFGQTKKRATEIEAHMEALLVAPRMLS